MKNFKLKKNSAGDFSYFLEGFNIIIILLRFGAVEWVDIEVSYVR